MACRSFRRRGSRTALAVEMEASPHPPIRCAGASELSPAKSTRAWFNVILKGQSQRHGNWTFNLLLDRRSPGARLQACVRRTGGVEIQAAGPPCGRDLS